MLRAGGLLLILTTALACDATGVVSSHGGPGATAAACTQPTGSATFVMFGGCTADATNVVIGMPRAPVCAGGLWTLACHKTTDCPGGSDCDGSVCRVLCDTSTAAGCDLCGYGCMDGLCVPQ